MRAFAGYALMGAGLVAGLAGLVGWLLGPGGAAAVWWAAAVAYVVQLAAFGALLAFRSRPGAFMGVWAGGILLRLMVVGGAALWLVRWSGLELAPALLSLAGFLFVLLLLEPVFFLVAQRKA